MTGSTTSVRLISPMSMSVPLLTPAFMDSRTSGIAACLSRLCYGITPLVGFGIASIAGAVEPIRPSTQLPTSRITLRMLASPVASANLSHDIEAWDRTDAREESTKENA